MSTLCALSTLLVGTLLIPMTHADDDGLVSLQTPQGLNVRLDIRQGTIAAAAGHAPRYNKMPGTLDTSALTITDHHLTGILTASIPSDGYVGPTNLVVPLDLPLTGQLRPRPSPSTLARLVLQCENALHPNHKVPPHKRRVRLELALRHGHTLAVRATTHGSITDVDCAVRVGRVDIQHRDHRLTGDIEMMYQPQDPAQPTTTYRYRLNGLIVGDLATGTITIQRDGRPLDVTSHFVGDVRWGDAPPAADALHQLTLHDALGTGRFLDLYFVAREGWIRHGFATSPNFNNATHDLQLTGVRVTDGQLTGMLAITVQPDPWVPADRQPIPCRYEITAALVDGQVTGQFHGTSGTSTVTNGVTGSYDALPPRKTMTGGTLKLENALHGNDGWHSRVFVAFDYREGRVTGGKLSNNHTKLAGTVDSGELTITDDRLTGKLHVTVTQADSVTPGRYEFGVDIGMVGAFGAGTFTSRHGDATKTGRLWGQLRTE